MVQVKDEFVILTLREAAKALKVSERTLQRLIDRREFPAFKVGGQWRVLQSTMQDWLKKRNPR